MFFSQALEVTLSSTKFHIYFTGPLFKIRCEFLRILPLLLFFVLIWLGFHSIFNVFQGFLSFFKLILVFLYDFMTKMTSFS